MSEFINVTISGEMYDKLKHTYDEVQKKKHSIDFMFNGDRSYGWDFYTDDQALNAMAEKYKFMIYKHEELLRSDMHKLKKKVEELELIKLELEEKVKDLDKLLTNS